MRCLAVSAVANSANLIAAPNPIASRNPNASRLHVRVERISSASDIQDGEVDVRLIDGKPIGKFARHLIGEVIARGDHDCVYHGENRRAINVIAARVLRIAAKEPPLTIYPLPIDGEAL